MARRSLSSSIKFENTAEFQRALKERAQEIQLKSERNLTIVGEKVVLVAKKIVPKASHATEEGIHSDPGRDARGFFVNIDSDHFVSHFLEFGTKNMPKKPFLRPAVARTRKFMRTQMRQGL